MTSISPLTLTPDLRRRVFAPPAYGPVDWTVAQLDDYARLVATTHTPPDTRRWRVTLRGARRVRRECATCSQTWPCPDQQWRREFERVRPYLADGDSGLFAPRPPASPTSPAGEPAGASPGGGYVVYSSHPSAADLSNTDQADESAASGTSGTGRHAAAPARRPWVVTALVTSLFVAVAIAMVIVVTTATTGGGLTG